MLTARCYQPVGHKDEDVIAEGGGIAAIMRCKRIDGLFQAELAPQVSCDQHGSPIPGSNRPDIVTFGRWLGGFVTMEQTAELIEIKVRRQQILATEIDDGLMPGFALVVAIGLNDAHVFVLDPPFATGGSDDPQEHGDLPQKLILRGSRHLRRFATNLCNN